jgi:prepilin-type N-terminal cleavage/methylation domain-containing protein
VTPRPRPARPAHADAGFSFVEILVVMSIIAVLAGLSVVVVQIMARKGPEMKTKTLLQRVVPATEQWKNQFHAYPPTNPQNIFTVTNLPSTKVARLPSTDNLGIRSLYLCLRLSAFRGNVELNDEDLMNTDDAALDKPLEGMTSPNLFEIKDAWGNPLVYINSQQYDEYTKNPPTYVFTDPTTDEPQRLPVKPWRSEKTGAFEQARSYQLFSVGPDGQPNTEDDLKAWDQ